MRTLTDHRSKPSDAGVDELTVQVTRSFGEDDPGATRTRGGGTGLTHVQPPPFSTSPRSVARGRPSASGHRDAPAGRHHGTTCAARRNVGRLAGSRSALSRFVTWIDLQTRLQAGEHIEGYTDADVRMALGLDEAHLP
jgi:hypothetical protein